MNNPLVLSAPADWSDEKLRSFAVEIARIKLEKEPANSAARPVMIAALDFADRCVTENLDNKERVLHTRSVSLAAKDLKYWETGLAVLSCLKYKVSRNVYPAIGSSKEMICSLSLK